MPRHPIYLDYHSTTPVDERVLQAMLPYFNEIYGNPASRFHEYGWKAQEAVDQSRQTIAGYLGAEAEEIIFTGGSTESNNLAIRGIIDGGSGKGGHIITCRTEHKSVLEICAFLANRGCEVTYLPVDETGLIDTADLEKSIRKDTALISLMAANNEIGVLHPIGEIGRIARKHGVIFHCDATQAIGKIPLRVDDMVIDLLSLSGHKIYAPKGTGLLYVRTRRPGIGLKPVIIGGGQERGLRSGSLNVPGIVGLAKAIELSYELLDSEIPRITELRDRLWHYIADNIPDAVLNGSSEQRICNNLNISFPGVEAQLTLMALEDVALSSGSACSGSQIEPSHVLRALYKKPNDARVISGIRIGLGRNTTPEEIEAAGSRIVDAVERIRRNAGSRSGNRIRI